ncbi:hypothetical protein J4217_01055 [Candidatus Pacearchaeota archaeon]|nr:hypothetical protein [Candidatus Pacearchaeota archaeon]
METLIFNSTKELKKNKKELEDKLNVSITITGKKADISGEAVDEYEAMIVLEAINFGFSAKKALMLKDQDILFQHINIKKFTHRKKLEDVRARLIGTEGKTKRAIENITLSHLAIRGNDIGIIAPADLMQEVITALTNLIRGSKQSNVYNFLERMNAEKKKFPDDLGLKKDKKGK